MRFKFENEFSNSHFIDSVNIDNKINKKDRKEAFDTQKQ